MLPHNTNQQIPRTTTNVFIGAQGDNRPQSVQNSANIKVIDCYNVLLDVVLGKGAFGAVYLALRNEKNAN